MTVGELAFLRVVGRWHRDGSPFCSTEVTRRGDESVRKFFCRCGRDGIAEICGGLVSKGLLKRERGTNRYSLTSIGVGAYADFRDTFAKPLRDPKGRVLPRRDAATEDDS